MGFEKSRPVLKAPNPAAQNNNAAGASLFPEARTSPPDSADSIEAIRNYRTSSNRDSVLMAYREDWSKRWDRHLRAGPYPETRL